MTKHPNADVRAHVQTERYVAADYQLGSYGNPWPVLWELRRQWSGRLLPDVRR